MRWLIIVLSLVAFKANAIPREIMSSYLERHELCVKDAMIRAPNQNEFTRLKEKCRVDYMRMVDGDFYSETTDRSRDKQTSDWDRFIERMFTLPQFQLETKRIYFNTQTRLELGSYYVTRGKTQTLVLWKDGIMLDYYAIPLTKQLHNARIQDGRIAISGLDFDIVYYAERQGNAYRVETGYGNKLGINAALFLADKAVIVYNDVPIGIILRSEAKEL